MKIIKITYPNCTTPITIPIADEMKIEVIEDNEIELSEKEKKKMLKKNNIELG